MVQMAGTPDMRECRRDIDKPVTKGAPLKLSNEEILQAFTDAIGGLAVALAKQVDPAKLVGDLRKLADEADTLGMGPSAGLLDEIARTVESRTMNKRG